MDYNKEADIIKNNIIENVGGCEPNVLELETAIEILCRIISDHTNYEENYWGENNLSDWVIKDLDR